MRRNQQPQRGFECINDANFNNDRFLESQQHQFNQHRSPQQSYHSNDESLPNDRSMHHHQYNFHRNPQKFYCDEM